MKIPSVFKVFFRSILVGTKFFLHILFVARKSA